MRLPYAQAPGSAGRAAILSVLAAVLAVALVLPAAAAAAPARPDLSRPATAILIDGRDGTILLSKNADVSRPMASTTKLMTALLTLEEAGLSDVYTAPSYRALAAESKINLRKGERMRVDDLLRALLLESANDAAATLAQGVAGSQAAFVRQMNERARQLGLTQTSYANAVGLDDRDNYSSARDLAKLARVLLRNPTFARIVDSPSAVLRSGSHQRLVDNRNDLVASQPFVDGVKTGHTNRAGYVLVGAAGGPGDSQVISVVMGEPGELARDADSLAMLRYGVGQFRRREVLHANRPVADADIAYRDEDAELVPARDSLVVARRGERVRTRVDAPDELKGELPAGERVGRITVFRDGKVVDRVRLVTAAEVPGAGPLRRAASAVGGGLILIFLLGMVSAATVVIIRARRTRQAWERSQRHRAQARAVRETEEPDPIGTEP
jgi:D-alanyl-D-alanine carboxypeptidase (penicillin-binding protein 5/6)